MRMSDPAPLLFLCFLPVSISGQTCMGFNLPGEVGGQASYATTDGASPVGVSADGEATDGIVLRAGYSRNSLDDLYEMFNGFGGKIAFAGHSESGATICPGVVISRSSAEIMGANVTGTRYQALVGFGYLNRLHRPST